MEIREDDFAGMLAAVETELDRPTIALALGVEPARLDLIASGVAPTQKVAERLRLLHSLSRRADLRDPGALLAAMTEGTRLPRLRTLFLVFVVADAVVFATVALVVVLRG